MLYFDALLSAKVEHALLHALLDALLSKVERGPMLYFDALLSK